MIGGNRRKDIGSAIGTGRGTGRRTTGIGGTVGNGSTERRSAGLPGGQLAREHGVGHDAKTTRLGLVVFWFCYATSCVYMYTHAFVYVDVYAYVCI